MWDVEVEGTWLKGRKRACWLTQFTILSGRAFKKIYRDLALLAAHSLSSVAVALVICILFSHDVDFVSRRKNFYFLLTDLIEMKSPD